jgi:hypothetical protein
MLLFIVRIAPQSKKLLLAGRLTRQGGRAAGRQGGPVCAARSV